MTYSASLFVRHIYIYIYIHTVLFRRHTTPHYLSKAAYLYIEHIRLITNILTFFFSLFMRHTEPHYLQKV